MVQQIVPYCPWDGHEFEEDEICCRICGCERVTINYSGVKDLSELDASSRTKWRKILYEIQPFPDNYTDSTFLIGLRRNANIRSYDYWALVYDAAAISQQISTVTLFVFIFISTYLTMVRVESVITLQMMVLIIGYIIRVICEISNVSQSKKNVTSGSPKDTKTSTQQGIQSDRPWWASPNEVLEHIQLFESLNSLLLLIGVLFGLSPVLATLTNSFSDDTIYALTIALMLIHVVSQDYGYILGSSDNFQAPVSLNAAIFASVLLGSRLPSTGQVFTLVFVAIVLFALFPIMRHHLHKKSIAGHMWLTFLMFIVCTGMLISLSTMMAISYIFGTIFITFGSPFWLLWIQKYKNEINGPWDEAIPSSAAGYYYSPAE